MSGYKRATVTISEQEYRRLHEADMKRRFREHTKVKAKNSGQTADLTNTLQQMENLSVALGVSVEELFPTTVKETGRGERR